MYGQLVRKFLHFSVFRGSEFAPAGSLAPADFKGPGPGGAATPADFKGLGLIEGPCAGAAPRRPGTIPRSLFFHNLPQVMSFNE